MKLRIILKPGPFGYLSLVSICHTNGAPELLKTKEISKNQLTNFLVKPLKLLRATLCYATQKFSSAFNELA